MLRSIICSIARSEVDLSIEVECPYGSSAVPQIGAIF